MTRRDQCPKCHNSKDKRAKQCYNCRKVEESNNRHGKTRSPSFFDKCICGEIKDRRAKQCGNCRIKANTTNKKPRLEPKKTCDCGQPMSWKAKQCVNCYLQAIKPNLSEPRACCVCGKTKPANEFYQSRHGKDLRRITCIDCCRINGRVRNKRSKCLKYGLSDEKAEKIARLNESECAICGTMTNNFHIDHCHKTNKFRGLLCERCNPGLGLFNDDPILLTKAVKYLNEFCVD